MKNTKAFSLIETMVAMVIGAISIAAISYNAVKLAGKNPTSLYKCLIVPFSFSNDS